MLTEMVKSGASDLHMVPGVPPTLRLRGDLVPTKHGILSHQINEQLFFEMMAPEQKNRLQTTLELDMAYEIQGLARFRCNYFYQVRGISAVFRQIPADIKALDKLGMPAGIKNILMVRKGLVLVTGPTGSGKSTTLAAIIDHINSTTERHIITVEDPLEFVHGNKKSLITQREIGAHAKSFADALRVASREDPDIILIGEMRDLETIFSGFDLRRIGDTCLRDAPHEFCDQKHRPHHKRISGQPTKPDQKHAERIAESSSRATAREDRGWKRQMRRGRDTRQRSSRCEFNQGRKTDPNRVCHPDRHVRRNADHGSGLATIGR